jgi:hypothetical protein
MAAAAVSHMNLLVVGDICLAVVAVLARDRLPVRGPVTTSASELANNPTDHNGRTNMVGAARLLIDTLGKPNADININRKIYRFDCPIWTHKPATSTSTMPVRVIAADDEFPAALETVGSKLLVVDFFAQWCVVGNPCPPICLSCLPARQLLICFICC